VPRCQMFVITNGRKEISDRVRSNGRKKQREGQGIIKSGTGSEGNKSKQGSQCTRTSHTSSIFLST
jgi:hypothetical protein